jgi:hypothetical protein
MGGVKFFKDNQGLPYINLYGPGQEAAIMLLETAIVVGPEESKEWFINMQTVRKNYEGYTKLKILKAKKVQRAQGLIGNPSKSNFKGMVRGNMIRNYPITSDKVTNTCTTFGPDLASIRGKTVRQTPVPVVVDYVEVTQSLVQNNKVVTMAGDDFFVDETAFLFTESWRIKFITAEYLQVRTATNLCKHQDRVLQVYARAGFLIRTIIVDGKFKKLRTACPT